MAFPILQCLIACSFSIQQEIKIKLINWSMMWKQREVKRPAVAGVEPRTPLAWACQYSATEPQQPDNHQPSQYPAVVAQWQSTGGSNQRCPGFNSWHLLTFSLLSIFASWHLNSSISSVRQDALSKSSQAGARESLGTRLAPSNFLKSHCTSTSTIILDFNLVTLHYSLC